MHEYRRVPVLDRRKSSTRRLWSLDDDDAADAYDNNNYRFLQ